MNEHIGLITYALDRAPGGIGRYTSELLAELRQADISLTVLQAGTSEDREGVVGLPGAGLLPALLTFGQLQIAWVARKRRLALVHDPTGTVPLGLLQRQRVATIHDVIPFIYPKTSTVLDWLIYRVWLPLIVRRLDIIITVSQQSKADIVRYLKVRPEAIAVIPEAANECFRPLDRDYTAQVLQRYGINFPFVLFVGSVESRKNLPRVLEAFADLRTWSQRYRLVIVGARKWKSSPVYETVERLGLAEYVHFTGFVEDEDLPAFYNGASVFVFPSLYEGFGLPILEAMACGTPVITSGTSSLPEVAGDAAILVDPFNVAEIRDAMRRVLEDMHLAAALREKGLVRAAEFTWARTARETIALYRNVLARR